MFFSHMNLHVCEIQEGKIHWDRVGKFSVNKGPEHPISILLDLMKSLRCSPFILSLIPKFMRAHMCLISCVLYRVPSFIPRCNRGPVNKVLWRFHGSLDA